MVFAHKPVGLGSAALVGILKKQLHCRVGHTGTLDRFAEGLMILPVGRATVFAGELLGESKTYRVEFRLGLSTDTHDPTGEVLEERSLEEVREFHRRNCDEIHREIRSFQEYQEQLPPLYSALKKEGRRYSDRAREGSVELPSPRSIRVYSVSEPESDREAGRIRTEMQVSKGTYIRAFARDLSGTLKFPVCISRLCRTQIGRWKLEKGVWHPGENEPEVRSVTEILSHWPVCTVEVRNREDVYVGRKISAGAFREPVPDPGKPFFIKDTEGCLLACAESTEKGYRYRKVFSGVDGK